MEYGCLNLETILKLAGYPVWGNNLPPVFNHFIWPVLRAGILINQERVRPRFSDDSQESMVHIFVHPEEIFRMIESLATNICSMMRTNSLKSPNRSIFVKWNPPKKGCVKVNTDRTSIDNGNYSTIGGVLRDCHGNWIAGSYRFVGRCPILIAELWAIYHGLQVARHRGYFKVILESDSKATVNMLNVDSEDVMMASLIWGIKIESRQFSM
ncbi:hypothetical protein Golax_000796, partial [Gossypium laxum]|nr:hypothetical protein [Gossypium laxum]